MNSFKIKFSCNKRLKNRIAHKPSVAGRQKIFQELNCPKRFLNWESLCCRAEIQKIIVEQKISSVNNKAINKRYLRLKVKVRFKGLHVEFIA